MKRLLHIIIILILTGCQEYSQESEPLIFMGGGKWTFIDYSIVVVNSLEPITIKKNDTICINSFCELWEVENGFLLKQDFRNTSISRRFIKNKTMWEFDGYDLYCEWINTPGGMQPSHDPFWVSFPNYLYTKSSIVSIFDGSVGIKTDFSFKTNNVGVAPPNELIMVSPNIMINLYSSSGARDKAVTLKIILTFLR